MGQSVTIVAADIRDNNTFTVEVSE